MGATIIVTQQASITGKVTMTDFILTKDICRRQNMIATRMMSGETEAGATRAGIETAATRPHRQYSLCLCEDPVVILQPKTGTHLT